MMTTRWDVLLTDCRLATMRANGVRYGAIEDAALGYKDGTITFAAPMRELTDLPEALADRVESMGSAWITPGLIDCHTHLVFGGDRADEFERRLGGATYEDIARDGGGIMSTVRATRAADENALLAASLSRAKALVADGATTLEIKSGYGLDLDSERKMLRVARRIGETLGIGISTTLLAAHALPPEFRDRPDAYIDAVCEDILPAVAREGLADSVDAFCERIAFTPAQTRRVFAKARELGIPVKLHADQLSDLGGAALAAEFGARSAEHLEHASEDGVRAMAAHGTVAVLLPGAYYALRETKLPPIDAFRANEVPIAIATDCNPGTSPLLSLRLAMSMACTLFRLTPEEALRGATANAAHALGFADRGVLEAGKRADFVVWNIERPADLCYWIAGALARRVVAGGRVLVDAAGAA